MEYLRSMSNTENFVYEIYMEFELYAYKIHRIDMEFVLHIVRVACGMY